VFLNLIIIAARVYKLRLAEANFLSCSFIICVCIPKGDSYHCVFSRQYILNLWCTKGGSNAAKLREIIEDVQNNIENNGYNFELNELFKSIGYICKRIAAFWTRYDQKKKETTELSIEEEKYFKEKIHQLKPTEFLIYNKTIIVQHSLQLTMVNGKVSNALSESSSTKFYICGAIP